MRQVYERDVESIVPDWDLEVYPPIKGLMTELPADHISDHAAKGYNDATMARFLQIAVFENVSLVFLHEVFELN